MTIIDSDAFLDMPLSTQSLYFHLSMRADDDGFINNPKKIQRMVGATDDDLKILIGKKFIIPFESGIVVIKHWKIHNYIRQDRYKETVYLNEKSLLIEKENKSYTLDVNKAIEASHINADTIGIPNDNQRLTQDRLGKDRLGKDRLGKDRDPQPPYNDIKDLFNKICKSYPSIKSLSDTRKKHIKARWIQFDEDINTFEMAFKLLEQSEFCKGNNNRQWKANFEWLIKNDTNMLKVLEGNYLDKGGRNGINGNSNQQDKAENGGWGDLSHLYGK